MSYKAENLVIDTTPFINNVQLQYYGKNLFTCQSVIDEIKSKRQYRNLLAVPFEFRIVDVDPDAIRIITEFSKKTGDYPSLSATDIKVMALTYQLENKHVGVEHLAKEPVVPMSNEIVTDISNMKHQTDSMPGWGKWYSLSKNSESTSSDEDSAEDEKELEDCDEVEEVEEEEEFETSEEENEDVPEEKSFEKETVSCEENKPLIVACMTTDFAMQNVLKQLKLNVISIDGRIIKHLRTFLLRCTTCFKTTSEMTRVFCKKCGYKTLKRVSYTLDENGQPQIFINFKKPLNTRGQKYSLPKIQGGKHAVNPHLVEDQRFPDQRLSKKARRRNNPMSDEYYAESSPFVLRDVTSRSVTYRQGTTSKYWMKKNPNESNRRKKH